MDTENGDCYRQILLKEVEGAKKLYQIACNVHISMWGYEEGENNQGEKRELKLKPEVC